jgi:hypothetical protein
VTRGSPGRDTAGRAAYDGRVSRAKDGKDTSVGMLGRVVGAVVGGAAAYGVLHLASWNFGVALPMSIILVLSAAFALAGFAFGPRVIEAVVHLL